MISETERLAALEWHVRRFWDGHIVELATWDRGPILERIPQFMTYKVFPKRAGDAWVYVTVGASLADSSANGSEFFVMSPVADDVHSETLAMVSDFNSFEAHRLTVGSVMNIGRPWMPTSMMDHLLVSLPYPYGPELEWASPEAGGARFLWLLPIYKSEADFIRSETLEDFELLLDAAAVNVLDPNRSSMV
ncbi:suppressor of fused domain protein [Micromonosporaceae bacterium DT55]|uniref:suppressor of fused domain protein n=1 Tax=Melissospora conviva TaxID=3388432 RepID=UPI003C154221